MMDVYLENGQSRTVAAALDWPGWCRVGRDADSALQALLEYAPRYARVIAGTPFRFTLPANVSDLRVVEQMAGNASTDFGVPALAPAADARPVDTADLEWFQLMLEACWRAFDGAVEQARGRELRKGPRGGGRDLEKMIEHVLGGETSYLTSLGGSLARGAANDAGQIRRTVLSSLAAAVRGEYPARGPRGGLRWSPRYFVRRLAWHDLDHAWELEDRLA